MRVTTLRAVNNWPGNRRRASDLPAPRALLESAIYELHRQFGDRRQRHPPAIGNLAAILWQLASGRGLLAAGTSWSKPSAGCAARTTRQPRRAAVLAAMQHDGMP